MTQFDYYINEAAESLAKAERHIEYSESLTRKVLVDNRLELAAHHIARAKVQVSIARANKKGG